MNCRLRLNFIFSKYKVIFKRLAIEKQALMIRMDSFFVLDLIFNLLDSITELNIKNDGLTQQGFYKYLSTSMRNRLTHGDFDQFSLSSLTFDDLFLSYECSLC